MLCNRKIKLSGLLTLLAIGGWMTGCSDTTGGGLELNCDSDPITPLPANFSATGYWDLNSDLQTVFPVDDSTALARHYCKFGSEENRPFGEDPVYSSSAPLSSSGETDLSEGGVSSSSQTSLSSSIEDDGCERTLVEDAYFLFKKGDTETGNPILRGWTENGVKKFSAGEKIVPKGYDCAAAVEISFVWDADNYNLFLVSAWKGNAEGYDSTLVEKVVIREKPSSSSVASSSGSVGDPCSGYPVWDSVRSWLDYEPSTLYSYDGALYRCQVTTTPANCAWSPEISYSDWVFERTCDGGGISSSKPISSSSKPLSSSSKPLSSSVAVSSSSKPLSSSSKPVSSSSITSGGHCVLNWFTEANFNSFFPNRHSVYTWTAFKEALAMVPNFICASAGSDVSKQKQELAAVFAHWGQEVAHLRYNEEICGTQGSCLNNYNTDWSNGSWPPVPGKSYHGRGAKQLSWPGNYGMASLFLFGDKNVLLKNPERVKNEGKLAFATSFWFWQENVQNGEKCSSVFWSTGFGRTTFVINGALECGWSYGAQAQARETFYGQYLSKLSVSDNRDKSTGCR